MTASGLRDRLKEKRRMEQSSEAFARRVAVVEVEPRPDPEPTRDAPQLAPVRGRPTKNRQRLEALLGTGMELCIPGPRVGPGTVPIVSVRPDRLALNAAARRQFGSPRGVYVLRGTTHQTLAIAPADEHDPNAFRLSVKGVIACKPVVAALLASGWMIGTYALEFVDGAAVIRAEQPA